MPTENRAGAGAELIHRGSKRMMRTVLGVAVLAFGTTALVAQTDPIAARKALMKAKPRKPS
jgi:hypothetical protein